MSAGQRDGSGVESIGEFIHKESSKENKRPKGSKALSLKVQGSMAVNTQDSVDNQKKESTIERIKESQKLTLRSASAELNATIDDVLLDLVMRNMIDEAYWKFHTKAVYTLGLQRYTKLITESVDGRNPKHLFAFKVKGALDLEEKRQLLRDKYEL